MDQKTHWPDTEHWSATELAEVRGDPATTRFESSWIEQRRLLDEFVGELDAAGHAALALEASAALRAASGSPHLASMDDWDAVGPGAEVQLGPWRLVVDAGGSVTGCVGPDGRDRAAPGVPILSVHQQTFDAADYERWYSTYNRSVTPSDEWWARWDNTKPGLERTVARSAIWPAVLGGLWSGEDAEGAAVVIDQHIRSVAGDPVAAPERYRTVLRWDEPTGRLSAELCWWSRPAARWPGTTWWQVAPAVSDPAAWSMWKVDEPVSPFDVVDGGGRSLHVADRVSHPDGVDVELVDTGLVAPGAPRPLVWDDARVDLRAGWHVCVLSNLWGTNFPMWNEGDGRCRVSVALPL